MNRPDPELPGGPWRDLPQIEPYRSSADRRAELLSEILGWLVLFSLAALIGWSHFSGDDVSDGAAVAASSP